MDHLQTSHTLPGQVPSQMFEAHNWHKMARQNTKHGRFRALQDDQNWNHATALLVWPSGLHVRHNFLRPSSIANLPPEADHVVIQFALKKNLQLCNIDSAAWETTAQDWSLWQRSCKSGVSYFERQRISDLQLKREKEEGWCHNNFSVSQLYHLWTWMCCHHRTLLTHGELTSANCSAVNSTGDSNNRSTAWSKKKRTKLMTP